MYRFFLSCALFVVFIVPTIGQISEITLTVVLYPGVDVNSPLTDRFFDAFEEAHPGTHVVAIAPEHVGVFTPPAFYDLDTHFHGFDGISAGVEGYVQEADVLFMFPGEVSLEATRAGYYLDLMPLVQADSDPSLADYFASAWESYQWDGGMWAIPASVSPVLWLYDPIAFDNANLPHPGENWSRADFFNAIDTLYAQNNELPSFTYSNTGILLRELLGQPTYDWQSSIPQNPDLYDDITVDVFDQLNTRIDAGMIDDRPLRVNTNIPLQLVNITSMPYEDYFSDDNQSRYATFSDGRVGLRVQGYAVSAGTQYPELAYELAKYLSQQPEIFHRFRMALPANRALVSQVAEVGYSSSEAIRNEIIALFTELVEQGIPASEMLLSSYLEEALSTARFEDVDVSIALQQVQEAATTNLDEATRLRETVNVVVKLLPSASMGSGDITLRFGVNSLVHGQVPDEEWDQLVADFVSEQPSMATVQIESSGGLVDSPNEYDCFYEPFNVSRVMDTSTILDMAPLLSADSGFPPDNLIGDVGQEIDDGGHIWGVPLVIYPEIMLIQVNRIPNGADALRNWTIEAFNTTQLVYSQQNTDAVFLRSDGLYDSHLLMLATARGANLVDEQGYLTTDLANPANVVSLAQVLDLTRDSVYQFRFLQNPPAPDAPVIATNLINAWSRIEQGYRPVGFPRGSASTPISYSVGYGYVSADTAYPELCYQWLQFVGTHPQTLRGIPANHAALNQQLLASVGSVVYEFYGDYIASLNDLNLIHIPGYFGNTILPGTYVEHNWLTEALTSHLLNEGDLESLLFETQDRIVVYRQCIDATNPDSFVGCSE